MNASDTTGLGFIGVGAMGEPMCGNIASKSGRRMTAFDLDPAPLERLQAAGVAIASSVAEVAAAAEIIFLSLPGRDQARAVCLGADGLLANGRSGQTIVDLTTATPALAREIDAACAAAGIAFADAPVARTREAAVAGTVSVMVGGDAATFERIRPLLAHMAAEITHCGPVGAGQTVKLMNNMVLFGTVVALAEALAVGRRSGVEPAMLFETMARGSADSFALRHHGIKAMIPGRFPEHLFSTTYALKDLSYALEMAAEAGIDVPAAGYVRAVLEKSAETGNSEAYFPALARIVDGGGAH